MTELDLRGTPCPLNYIRTTLALEKLPAGAVLQVDLDRGDPERLVGTGLRGLGHGLALADHPHDPAAVRLLIRKQPPQADA